jgi:hypothetical protein
MGGERVIYKNLIITDIQIEKDSVFIGGRMLRSEEDV